MTLIVCTNYKTLGILVETSLYHSCNPQSKTFGLLQVTKGKILQHKRGKYNTNM